ncbi:MAG: NAD(P)-binding protein [Acidimicrobiales bacterium]
MTDVADATAPGSTDKAGLDHEVVVIGAGVAGLYQIKRLIDLGVDAIVLEGEDDLGGTWYKNRYPGARFDSGELHLRLLVEPRELLEEWHWKERFSPQPETLRYLNFVADKFGPAPPHAASARRSPPPMVFDDDALDFWRSAPATTVRTLTTPLPDHGASACCPCRHYRRATRAIDELQGAAPGTPTTGRHEPVELAGQRVAVIGTGATAIQCIARHRRPSRWPTLTVYQRRPNWAAPLQQRPDLRRGDGRHPAALRRDLRQTCARTPGGFEHEPDRRGFHNAVPPRSAWRLLGQALRACPGFAIWLGNFVEIYVGRGGQRRAVRRVHRRPHPPAGQGPEVLAEKLIPKDHGFGVQRVPLETNYFEVYNRDNVRLVDLAETPIERITEHGIRTTAEDLAFDIIVYAYRFRCVLVRAPSTAWTFYRRGRAEAARQVEGRTGHVPGLLVAGFRTSPCWRVRRSRRPLPRAIEPAVDWATDLLQHVGGRAPPLRGRRRGRGAMARGGGLGLPDGALGAGPEPDHRVQLQPRRPRVWQDPAQRVPGWGVMPPPDCSARRRREHRACASTDRPHLPLA